MEGPISTMLLRALASKTRKAAPAPMLVELCEASAGRPGLRYEAYPFSYAATASQHGNRYEFALALPHSLLLGLRAVVQAVSENLDSASVEPLTFGRLIEVLEQLAAEQLALVPGLTHTRELSELVAFEAIGLSRILGLAKDQFITEFYIDSDSSPVYLDHSKLGRCDTSIMLTERERKAIETHMDTFRGYSLDYTTPSLKNDIEVAGARLRVSLDLDPVSVNRFALDVRRLNLSSLSLPQLVGMRVISGEGACLLVAWLELGGNVTVIGETGTGKTTLLNALDERLNPKLRRVYIEDAVETRDLLERGYHQVKIKVDPFERSERNLRTKGAEIVKVLHRSPDIVILSEIQSEEHSAAFFHSLSSGVRGLQTFHASSAEQAVRRWVNVHGIPKQSLLDLGILVQMSRPDRTKPLRIVSRICQIVSEGGEPRLRDLFLRDKVAELRRVVAWERLAPPVGRSLEDLLECAKRESSVLAQSELAPCSE
ncbi:MAG: type II/IV secretion system ATPase subunit [Nitrososphaerota archaeon]|nr:type II/IV secretion system ATPase subunit [Nitrososphaerota archaeon]